MYSKYLEEILLLIRTNKIDTNVARRILNSVRINKEEKDIHFLRLIFGKSYSKEFRAFFSRLYEIKACSLKDIEEVHEFFLKLTDSVYLDMNRYTNFDFKKVGLLFDLYRRLKTEKEVLDFILDKNTMNLSVEEIKLRKEIFFHIKTFSIEQKEKYKNSKLKETLEGELPIKKKMLFLSLIMSPVIFLNDEYCFLILERLENNGYSNAYYTMLCLKEERVRNNNKALNFVFQKENLLLLPLFYECIIRKIKLDYIYEISSIYQKEKRMRFYLEQHEIDKIPKKKLKEENRKYLGALYSAFLRNETSITALEIELKRVLKNNEPFEL